jgi:hypothetical protein
MHNKPGMKPLDSRTMSGKMIDGVIGLLDFDCVKTNLCDVEELPESEVSIVVHNRAWRHTYDPDKNDIIVLLGQWVHKNFHLSHKNIVKLPHPASVMGGVNKSQYLINAIDKIRAKAESIV